MHPPLGAGDADRDHGLGSERRNARGEDRRLQLAVSEATTNAVRHGREHADELLVQASVTDGALQVWITDRSGGMRPRMDGSGLGLGLPIMASVTDLLELVTDSEGTTVKMTFLF